MKSDALNHNKKKTSELKEIYILRAIACLSVILVHISAIPVASMESSNPILGVFILLNRATKYTTATFIFISGFVFFYRYHKHKFHYSTFLKKRFKNTLLPYVIWTILYYLYFIYEGYYTFSIRFLLDNFLLANMSYHLYFILTISQFYLLFGIFLKLFKRYNSHFLLLVFLIVNLLSLYFNKMQYADRFFTTYIFFFALGCYIARYYTTVKKLLNRFKTVLLFMYLSITLYDSYSFYNYYKLGKAINVYTVALTWFLFSLISIIFLLAISNYYQSKTEHWVFKRISVSSYYIYLSHPFVLMLSNKLLDNVGIYSHSLRFIINIVIVYSATLFLCFNYTILKEKAFINSKIPIRPTIHTTK